MTDIVKPSTLPGFMELLPREQILFNEMLDTIKRNYEKYGFLPLDTPVIEKSEVLLAKGGGETEKQIYRFQKGDTDMSLRFDLTVPLARYTVEHFNDLSFPFKRYQIGKVYRGEKAQKGRFREFYQCDIDTIGNEKLSILNDAEFPVVIYHTFKELGFDEFVVKLNNRKILNGFYKELAIEDTVSVLRTVDKLDKIGIDKVKAELLAVGVSEENADKILNFITIEGTNKEIIKQLENLGIENESFKEGVSELTTVIDCIGGYGVPETNYRVDLKVARGLDYYTGTVYETELVNYPEIGSVCSGGRYENLASYYTDKKLPGVGISIGLSRLFYQLNQANIIEAKRESLTDVMVIPMDEYEMDSIKLAAKLQEAGIATTVYTEKAKLGKKFKYADALNIPYTIVVGENEVQTGKYAIKDMAKQEQESLTIEQIIEKLK
ncbi:histidine--tRNA ligase [Peptoniphilus indolicus]|uniref:Histidine--tRNA ligase n=2 Tax=Peptoniphilus indolicus TaxID=33030 RepID=G4D1A5_9FIRM|nr:histidine--tRNA ligase [Peptoniphilus indolicus]EGY80694.1 histidine--tRNA ligase [Peptoniphilus indolicus ATCC 29427]SUB74888.1 Histidine--tRNA ligase [Peptoniphilus indolicus]